MTTNSSNSKMTGENPPATGLRKENAENVVCSVKGVYFPPGDLDDMIFFDSDIPLHSER